MKKSVIVLSLITLFLVGALFPIPALHAAEPGHKDQSVGTGTPEYWRDYFHFTTINNFDQGPQIFGKLGEAEAERILEAVSRKTAHYSGNCGR